ncbi:unnamed protein product [Angiostrongylus costaricensis]|uniref:Uncharacterized protein n=1 Tax=Angiostrongylus costaricensis TaxID=334426 RepID=A0A0R3PYH0_ANGCS|nr:unnamed protein product [Angiostrongylus costaricensis]
MDTCAARNHEQFKQKNTFHSFPCIAVVVHNGGLLRTLERGEHMLLAVKRLQVRIQLINYSPARNITAEEGEVAETSAIDQ